MYVAVKGGERAIANAHRWLAARRRGDPALPELDPAQIREQLAFAVDRVMNEGSCYDRDLAALAIKQAAGDLVEAAFLVRAYRTTLPRFGASEPIDTAAMRARRRVSAVFKDLPGGQVLGPTFDYTHRLIDFALLADGEPPAALEAATDAEPMPQALDALDHDGLIQAEHDDAPEADVPDLTREPLLFPAERALRLQNLARGDEGFLLALGYSTQRGFGGTHPFVGELRMGEVAVELVPEELGFAVEIGTITLTECQMVNQFEGSHDEPPQFTRGYGLAFGHVERRAMSMALVDRALRDGDAEDGTTAPAQDQEFVLYHSDNVQAMGFVEHLKLPHYVDFQAELEAIRRLRVERATP
jgi:alpha-D-ribose 1-methylphosphonate 5-triphosphate synthase subunit PhnI